jgi:hypothetical protein
MGTRGFFSRVKQPGREADHSPQASAEVKRIIIIIIIIIGGAVLSP